jgi:methyl-accepting chemotaxis protein
MIRRKFALRAVAIATLSLAFAGAASAQTVLRFSHTDQQTGARQAAAELFAKKVEELGKHSDQIGQIIGVIDDIADQTNLLALNAAIEAARAGEQGRGFAVVADEVRKLADRTSTATKEIAEMITTIQSETKHAVEAMQAGTLQVERGVESTSEAGQSLSAIIHMSQEVGDMITRIVNAATEQSVATEHVNSSIEQIARITAVTAAAAQQTTAAFEHLSGLAQKMQDVLGQFRLDSSGRVDGGPAIEGRDSAESASARAAHAGA